MKRQIIATFCLYLVVSFFYYKNARSENIGFSAGIDYTSDYLWRGMYWYNHDGAFFPNLSFIFGDVSIGYIGEYSEDYVTGKDSSDADVRRSDNLHSADFGIDYAHSFSESATFGASLWYYRFIEDSSYTFFTGTFYITIDSLKVKPTIKYSHDYYQKSKKKKDFYVQFGLNRDFNLKNTIFGIAVTGGYYRAASMDKKGFSDITTTVSLSTDIGNTTFSGSFNYIFIPGKDYYRIISSSGNSVNDRNRTFAAFSAAYSL